MELALYAGACVNGKILTGNQIDLMLHSILNDNWNFVEGEICCHEETWTLSFKRKCLYD